MSSHVLSIGRALPLHRLPYRAVGWPGLLLIAAAAVLAFDPALWLVKTWRDPAYDSAGYLVFTAAAALFVWSLTSPLAPGRGTPRRPLAIALLAVSAAVRLASQVLAINTIGALCLVIDVYAIGLLFGLDRRRRAMSPAWLAVVFAFSLPLERVLQRTVGYLLQEFSAQGACYALSALYDDLVCRGVRLIVNGVDVLVDLPCSGARTLLLGLMGFAVASAICRPGVAKALAGLVLTLGAAALANILRITILAVGLAEPDRLGGIRVMEQPWHDLIGLCALAIVCVTIVIWARWCGIRDPGHRTDTTHRESQPSPRQKTSRTRFTGGIAALAVAAVIVSLPRTAVDVARASAPAALPMSIDGYQRHPVPLTDREEQFFARFGGSAAKAEYGPHGLLVTRTTSPLRHLHAPEDCLRGLGFEVEYLGAAFDPIPTAIYRAIAPDGARYRIDVSFVSDQGAVTTNVSTAVWLWLQGRAGAWTAVQRISPESIPLNRQARFTDAVLAALDLPRADPGVTPQGARIR